MHNIDYYTLNLLHCWDMFEVSICKLESTICFRYSVCIENIFLFFFQRLIVCLEESLYIHNIRDMKVLHTIRDTPPNLTGLCALSINNDNCFLAYPGSNQIGEVQIFDTINLVRSYKYNIQWNCPNWTSLFGRQVFCLCRFN